MISVHRLGWLLFIGISLAAAIALGQEAAGVPFDPTDLPLPAWKEGIVYGALLLYVYGYWRLLRWLVNRYRQHPLWRRTRVVIPILMVCVAAFCFVAGRVSAVALVALLAVTFPSFVPALVIVGVFELDGWVAGVIGVALAWPTWYAIIRFTEWRLDVTRPVSLRIA